MAPQKQPRSKLGRTAKFYRDNPWARAVKKKKDTEVNKRATQRKKRSELWTKRKALAKKGVNLKGKDLAHTSKGIKLKSIKANRGNSWDTRGDRNARGKKKKS